jgi:hypothetical protein
MQAVRNHYFSIHHNTHTAEHPSRTFRQKQARNQTCHWMALIIGYGLWKWRTGVVLCFELMF